MRSFSVHVSARQDGDIATGLEKSLEIGYEWCEYSWILEYNQLTKRSVRLMDGELYKVYRVYQKEIVSA